MPPFLMQPKNTCKKNFQLRLALIILSLKRGQMLYNNDTFIAGRLNENDTALFINGKQQFQRISTNFTPLLLNHFCKIFSLNDEELNNDFKLITNQRVSHPLSLSNKLIGSSELLFIEEGAKI